MENLIQRFLSKKYFVICEKSCNFAVDLCRKGSNKWAQRGASPSDSTLK